jgi:hypothetical protein
MNLGKKYAELYSCAVRKGMTTVNGNMFGEFNSGGGTGVTRTVDVPNKRVVFEMGTGNGNIAQLYDFHDWGYDRATSHTIQLGHDTPTVNDTELQAELRYNNVVSTDYYVLYVTPTPATHSRTYKWELIKKENGEADVLLDSSDTAVPMNTPFEVFIGRDDDGDLVVLLDGVELLRSTDTAWQNGFQETWFRNATANGLTCYRYDVIIYRKLKNA